MIGEAHRLMHSKISPCLQLPHDAETLPEKVVNDRQKIEGFSIEIG
jgi:hypothetical protein